jgi:rhomboid protease GluP
VRHEPAPPDDGPEERPSFFRDAPVTAMLIVANVVVFLIEIAYALRAHELPGIFSMPLSALLATGGNYSVATVREVRVETLLASCFVHGGLLHIGFNMMALRNVGTLVERIVGPARMLPMYLLSGVVGAFASSFWHWAMGRALVSVGASGAICGLIGAALVVGWRVEGRDSPLVRGTARWLVSILVIGFLPGVGIDNAAHIGGAVAGAVIAMLWRRGLVYGTGRKVAWIGASVLFVLAAGARVVERDLRDPYATLMVADRINVAMGALEAGDCAVARTAIGRAARLTPDAPEVLDGRQAVAQACGGL